MDLSRTLAILCLALVLLGPPVAAQGEAGDTLVGYYFTSDGCSHCANVNPHMLGDWLETYPDMVVVEYELATRPGNYAALAEMDRKYHTGLSVPFLFVSPADIYTGDTAILSGVPILMEILEQDPAARPAGSLNLSTLDPASLEGMPRVWRENRILIRTGPGGDSRVLERLLGDPDPTQVLGETRWTRTTPEPVSHPGVQATFQHAVQLNGWLFQWNGVDVKGDGNDGTLTPEPTITPGECEVPPPLEVGKIMTLAAVNAINPCGLAVLIVVLLSLITQAPGNRRRVLFAGLAFTAAVFIFYFLYGIVMVALFQMVPQLASMRIWLTRFLGVVAIVIGLFYIRDAFSRTSAAAPSTAIPTGWKGSLKGLLDRISSPAGAFLVGAVVTLFLLPCTIGPYIISCGILSAYDTAAALPYLILYNVIFVLPMLAVTLIVYLGVSRLSDVKEWRDRSVPRMRLVAGIVILVLGILIVLGIF
ncbi:MAG: cytochrome c biogenesis CcdA family protein [Methanomicrobiales archaeon]|nr:cytochrome c biogenesis CcdA family protein [Methanomicrobiales archaeon]